MAPPKQPRLPSKKCKAPACERRVPWHEGMRPSHYARLDACSPSCGVALGHTRRESHRERQLHRCALPGCREWVPRIEGEHEARYRKRRYHADKCRSVAKGRAQSERHRKRAAWLAEQRVCALDTCAEKFRPGKAGQRYHRHACSVLARGRGKPRETKLCTCGCGQMFERPPGVSGEAWARRRYVNAEHRRRAGWLLPSGKPRSAPQKPAPARKPARRTRTTTKPVPVMRSTWRPTGIGRDVRPQVSA